MFKTNAMLLKLILHFICFKNVILNPNILIPINFIG